MFIFIALLIVVGLIAVAGFFGYKQFRKLHDNMNVMFHRQTQACTMADVDQEVEKRYDRMMQAKQDKNTERLWQLITVCTEEGLVSFLGLQGKEAMCVRGRSRVRFVRTTTGVKKRQQRRLQKMLESTGCGRVQASNLRKPTGSRTLHVG